MIPASVKDRTAIAMALLLAVACTTAHAEERFVFTPAETPGARLFLQDNIPIAIFAGTPAEIGRQHAELLAPTAARVLTFPRRFAAEAGADRFWPLMVGGAHMLMRNVPPQHRQEFDALVARAELDAGDVAVGNTLLELRRMGCSVAIVDGAHSATGGPLFGRNFDFPTLEELDQFSLVAVYHPDGRRAFASIGFPGMIGAVSGMNDAGLAVATLDVYRSGDGSAAFDPAGVPLAFVFRRILEECATVDEAETLLRSVKATTWMNLAVCDRDAAAVFEITPKTIARRDPHEGVLACTNHFRTPGLVGPKITCWRFPGLSAAANQPLTVDQVRQRLDDANQGELTLQTMVFEPRTLKLHLALGKPPTSDDELKTIDLAPLFAEDAAAANR